MRRKIIACLPDFEVAIADIKHSALFERFRCGNDELDRYLKKECLNDQNRVTYLFIEKLTGLLLGYATISSTSISVTIGSYIDDLPAAEIVYFAVNKKWQKKCILEDDGSRFYVSDGLLSSLIYRITNISVNAIGIGYIVAYAVPKARRFYKRNLFEPFQTNMNQRHTWFLDGCTAMYKEL